MISLGIPDRGLVPMEGLVDSQASQPLSFVVVCTQTCYASVACMICMLGHETHDCNIRLCMAPRSLLNKYFES